MFKMIIEIFKGFLVDLKTHLEKWRLLGRKEFNLEVVVIRSKRDIIMSKNENKIQKLDD